MFATKRRSCLFRTLCAGMFAGLVLGAAATARGQAGPVVCWGHNDAGECNPPGDVLFTQVAAGYLFSLGIDTSAHIVHWGDTSHGQDQLPTGDKFVQVSAGYDHGIALTSEGHIKAWGGLNSLYPSMQGTVSRRPDRLPHVHRCVGRRVLQPGPA